MSSSASRTWDPMTDPNSSPTPIDPGERALAVIGVKAVISKTIERVTAPQRKEMRTLEKTIAANAKALCLGELKCSWPALPSYQKLLDDLSDPLDIHQAEAMIEQLDDPEATVPFLGIASRAFNVLQDALPRSPFRSLAGMKNLPVSSPDLFHFVGLLRVLDDPLQVLELAAAGALLKYQVAAVRQIYPTVSAAIDGAVRAAIVAAKSKSASFELPIKAEAGLSTWLGIPIDISVYQQLYRAADQRRGKPPEPTRTSIEAAAKAAMTPAERIQQR